MSGISVSRGEDGALLLRKGDSEIVLTELRRRPMSNFRTPHQILGRGGASVALTDQEFVWLLAEYIRYTALMEDIDVSRKQVGFEFVCRIKRGV